MERLDRLMPLLQLILISELLMGIGFALCPEGMLGGTISTVPAKLGWILIRTGGAIGYHIPAVLSIGIPLLMEKKHRMTAVLSSLILYLEFADLSAINTIHILIPSFSQDPLNVTALQDSMSMLSSLLLSWLAIHISRRFQEENARTVVSAVFISLLSGMLFTAVYLFCFPALWKALFQLGVLMKGGSPLEAGACIGLMRLLRPAGLDLPLREALWLKEYGLGDWNAFFERNTASSMTWPIGIYMSGILPCMISGVPAMLVFTAKRTDRKYQWMMALMAYVCFLCGAGDALELMILTAVPEFWPVYSALFFLMGVLSALTPFRSAVGFEGGFADWLISLTYPASSSPLWLLLLCAAAALLFPLAAGLFMKKSRTD